MSTHTRNRMQFRARRRERGVVIFISLIVLVAMTLAGIALVRSIDTATIIAGNLAFKQTTTQSADAGTESGITWIGSHSSGTTLYTASAADGYYANWMEACDLTGNVTPSDSTDDVNWDGTNSGNSNCNAKAKAVASSMLATGYSASYVIHRMCDADGNPNSTTIYCATFKDTSTSSAGSTKGGGSYGSTPLPSAPKYYYRITTRVVGPRNSVSFVQAVIYM